MKTITHHYGPDLDWVQPLAEQLEGKVEGNFIKVPEYIHTGNRYFLECGKGVSAMYLDVKYNTDLQLIQQNNTKDFIGIYYNLTEGEARLSSANFANNIGRWGFDLSVIDSSLDSEYFVKSGSRTFALFLFIKKDLIASFLDKNKKSNKKLSQFFNHRKNILGRFYRMSYDSVIHLNELRNKEVGTPGFNLDLISTVYLLISEFLEKILAENESESEINETDLLNIIAVKKELTQNLKRSFPGIEALASKANMSVSKFKLIFRKIVKTSPKSYFINNKLLKAKELLEENELTIAQICDQLDFCTDSYFRSKFKKRYKISPKVYTQQLL